MSKERIGIKVEKYDFILMYEYKVRELDNLCLLKYELDKRGYRTKILYMHDLKLMEARSVVYETDVLVIGACYASSTIQIFASFRIKFKKIVNLYWEQLLSKEIEQDKNSIYNFTGLAKEVVHIAWGEDSYRRLVKKVKISPQKVKITGHIAMDFLRSELRGFYLSRDEICDKYGLDKSKKICLFIAGFDEISDQEKEDLIKKVGKGHRLYLEIADKTQITILQWFEQFLSENEDYIIVYRPHPGDDFFRELELTKRYKNFKVILELSVKQWIIVSDFISTWNSTAIVEAFFAGRNTFILQPYSIPDNLSYTLFQKMNMIQDYPTFYRAMMGESMELGLTDSIIEKYYYRDKKIPSYVMVCDVLENVYKKPEFEWTIIQKWKYWKSYKFKERIAIALMKYNFLYQMYLWILDNIPFPVLKRRKEWLLDRWKEEEIELKKRNAREVENVENIIKRIEQLLEQRDKKIPV